VSEAASTFEACVGSGGVAVFPADTVYGLACDPASEAAVRRLYAMKGRELSKPSAVMWFDRDAALAALDWLSPELHAAVSRLLPGAVSLLVPNPLGRYPLACGEDAGTLGVRVPVVPALEGVRIPVLQSSANRAGGAEARRLSEVDPALRAAADLTIDGGELPGTASTVIDLRAFAASGTWSVVRAGAVPTDVIAAMLAAL
jgi:L-threonylcarbamoyladenylate synthase